MRLNNEPAAGPADCREATVTPTRYLSVWTMWSHVGTDGGGGIAHRCGRTAGAQHRLL